MKELNEILLAMEISASLLAAGIFGAFVSLKKEVNKKKPFWTKVMIIICGGLIANYTSNAFILLIPNSNEYGHFFGFILGFTGIGALDALWNKLNKLINPKTDKDV